MMKILDLVNVVLNIIRNLSILFLIYIHCSVVINTIAYLMTYYNKTVLNEIIIIDYSIIVNYIKNIIYHTRPILFYLDTILARLQNELAVFCSRLTSALIDSLCEIFANDLIVFSTICL